MMRKLFANYGEGVTVGSVVGEVVASGTGEVVASGVGDTGSVVGAHAPNTIAKPRIVNDVIKEHFIIITPSDNNLYVNYNPFDRAALSHL
jgi:outer membrane lipoprotein SlyB